MAYFSNGSEGAYLDNQCAECVIGRHPDAPCPVLLMQITWNYDQIKDGEESEISEVMNILIDKKGDCKMKEVLDKYVKSPDENDPELFYNEILT